jgi:hypothetical protein
LQNSYLMKAFNASVGVLQSRAFRGRVFNA